MPTKFRDLVKLLKDDGWELDPASGSHYIYTHPAKGSLTVPFHGGNNEIAPGTLRNILKQAGLK
jgi:predicted RNA binding protein YcfA (HicA-like mRNA interferase family)